MNKGKEIGNNKQQGPTLTIPRDDEEAVVRIQIRRDECNQKAKKRSDEGSGGSSREKWFRFLMEEGGREPEQTQSPRIPKVPLLLRKNNKPDKKYFEPSVVAIGPYHHDSTDELRDGERLKFQMAYQFFMLNEIYYNANPIEELYCRVAEVSSNARSFYDESSIEQFDDETFTRMMFLDGCFILQFIQYRLYDYEKLEMSDHVVASVQRDLLLLENQIPSQVLVSLFPPDLHEQHRWMVRINDFIEDIRKLPNHRQNSELKNFSGLSACRELKMLVGMIESRYKHLHLLGLLYSRSIDKGNCGMHQAKRETPDRFLYYPAKELKKFGIKFKPSRTTALTDVIYKSTFLAGILKLPPLTIDESTKSMLLNLLAYETCAGASVKPWVTAYICFMDSLINDVEDVKELRSTDILFNFLGTDQDVADLFNQMASYLVPNPCAYIEVKRGINSQCKSNIKKWIAEFLQVYFSSPWTFIAVIAATFAIILTAIQTYVVVFPS